MLNMKKAMVAGASLVLAAGMVAPFGAGSVASAEEGAFELIEEVSADTISLTAKGDYTVTTKIGSKKAVNDIYESVEEIDISYLAGKEAEITVTQGKGETAKSDTFKVAAQPKKLKAVFNPKSISASLELDGKDVEEGAFSARIGSNVAVDPDDLTMYTVKGATLYMSTLDVAATKKGATYTPASKEVKVKIPAKKNGPKVTVDPKKFTFKLAKGCAYCVKDGDKIVSHTAASTEVVSLKDVNKLLGTSLAKKESVEGTDNKYREISSDITLKFYKVATDKVMESKATVVEIPAQAEADPTKLIECAVTYNKKGTEATGISVKSVTSSAVEFMVVGKETKLDEINLADKTTKWTTLKKKDATKKVAAKNVDKDKMIIVRVAGQKANTKKGVEFALASQITTSGAVIVLPEKVKTDLAVSLGQPAQAVTTASKAAITVTDATDGATYTYEVADKEKKEFKIGEKAPGTKITEKKADVEAKKGKWIIVYAEKDGAVFAFKSLKVEESHLK